MVSGRSDVHTIPGVTATDNEPGSIAITVAITPDSGAGTAMPLALNTVARVGVGVSRVTYTATDLASVNRYIV